MKIKKWKKPRITELMHGIPAELVLAYCKDMSASFGATGPKCCLQYDCAYKHFGGCSGTCASLGPAMGPYTS